MPAGLRFEDYLCHIERDADLLARAAQWGGLDAPVPTCPRWDVRRLIGHVVKAHAWVRWILAHGEPAGFEFETPAEEALVSDLLTGAASLASALRAAPESLSVWTFLPAESSRVFWARRQAHETAIHRVDAELASQIGVSEFEADFAVDGLDELLLGYLPGWVDASAVSTPFSVTITPLDANAGWTVSLSPDGFGAVATVESDSDLSVFGLASDLYRWAWNRASDDEVSLRGRPELADEWRRCVAVRSR